MNGKSLTPFMNKFGETHLYLPQYRVQAPWTKPSTASLFTGQYVRNHATFLGGDIRKFSNLGVNQENTDSRFYGHILPQNSNTLAERLQSVGFTNAGFTAIGHISKNFQFNQGFQTYLHKSDRPDFKDFFLLRTSIFWLLKNQPKKTFIYLHLGGPHFPYDEGYKNLTFWRNSPNFNDGNITVKKWRLGALSDIYMNKIPRNRPFDYHYEKNFIKELYGADVNYYDQFVFQGAVNILKSLSLYKSSFFTVTSDHGESLFDHEDYYGHGANLYEESIRVPLFMKFPQKNRIKDHPSQELKDLSVESIDLTATLLDFAEANQTNIQGNSLIPYLKKESIKQHPFTTALSEKPATRYMHLTSLVNHQWKYIHNYKKEEGSLFNLNLNSREQNPITSAESRKRSLQKMIHQRVESDSRLKRTNPETIKGVSDAEMENLRGLGYVD